MSGLPPASYGSAARSAAPEVGFAALDAGLRPAMVAPILRMQ